MNIDGVLFSDDRKTLVKYPDSMEVDAYTVPEGVEVIGDNAFFQHSPYKVILPDSIIQVGENAFSMIDRLSVEKEEELRCFTYELPAKPVKIGVHAFTPFKFYKYHGLKRHDHRTILRFRYKDTTIPVELRGNWKSNSDELKLADFIETRDRGRKKSIFHDVNSTEYKKFMAFYLALVYKDSDASRYLHRTKKNLSEDPDYSTLFFFLDTDTKRLSGEEKAGSSLQIIDLAKWSMRDLPDGNYEIEKYKGNETVVEIPKEYNGSRVISIGEKAFSAQNRDACNRITKVIVPEGIVSIKEKAFESCSSLKEIVLPASLKEIKSGAFQFCDSLDTIALPELITIIEKDTFKWCKRLHSALIGQSVVSIKSGAFSGCATLESIDLPDSLISIGSTAFHGCKKLKGITLPQYLEEVGVSAFGYCASLETIYIPSKTHLDICVASPFGNCKKLKAIIPDEDSREYSGIDGVLFDKERKTILCYPPAKGTGYVIPEGVENIGNCAFEGCNDFASITIPKSVIRIGDSAFNGCRSITKLEIPESVGYIGENALPQGCTVYTPAGSWVDKYCLKNRIFVIDSSEEELDARSEPKPCVETAILDGKTLSSAGFSEKEETEISKTVEANGGKYLFNFSTELDYLIYNPSCSSEPIKMKKARLLQKKGLSISFITIDDYYIMISN